MAIVQVPITKAKGFLELDTDNIPEDVYREVVLQGLKVLLNRGASKITKAAYASEDEMKAAALAKAEEQVELVKTSKIKFTGGKAKKASGAVMTEARRIAKALVKDALKEQGYKISHIAAKDITAAANALLDSEDGPGILAEATANLEERAKKPALSINLGEIVKEDPKLVAKAEAEKEAKRKTLSAKQAGKPKLRVKGQAQPQASA